MKTLSELTKSILKDEELNALLEAVRNVVKRILGSEWTVDISISSKCSELKIEQTTAPFLRITIDYINKTHQVNFVDTNYIAEEIFNYIEDLL